MKKQYVTPLMDIVNVRLYSSVLQENAGVGTNSQGIGGDEEWNDAKENRGIWDSGIEDMEMPKGGSASVWGGFENIDDL